MTDLAQARHELYAAAPADFVAERKRLAKALAAAGDKPGAAALKKLKKPPAGVWGLNQVARQDPTAIEALIEAGARMAAEHANPGEDFRAVTAGWRAALASVSAAALVHSPTADARRLARTLEALPFAPAEQQAAARRGELDVDLEPPDVFDAAPLAAAPLPSRPPPRRKDASGDAAEARRAAEAARRAAAEVAEAARREAEAAAEVARRAEAEVSHAAARVEAAARDLAAAEGALAAARARAGEARAEATVRDEARTRAEAEAWRAARAAEET